MEEAISVFEEILQVPGIALKESRELSENEKTF